MSAAHDALGRPVPGGLADWDDEDFGHHDRAGERRMSEKEFTRQVLVLAQTMGLLTHFCADARNCAGRRGFPDLVIVGKYGVLFAELKTDAGDTSLEQDLWLWTLNSACGRSSVANVALWRPEDLSSGVIETMLRALCEKPDKSVLKNGRRNFLPGLAR